MKIELEQPEKKPTASDSFIPPKDEKRTLKSEIQKMKELGWKDGWNYFLDYYRNPTLVTIAIIAIVISLSYSIIQNKRPYVIQVYLCNNYVEDTETLDTFCESFAEHMGMNLKDYQMMFNVSDHFDPTEASEEMTAAFYKLAAMISSAELDIIGGDRVFVDYYSFGEEDEVFFSNLSEVLPKDLFAKLETENRLYYSKYLDENGKAIGEYVSAIDISGTRVFDEADLWLTPCYVGITSNTQRQETAIEFLRWIFYME